MDKFEDYLETANAAKTPERLFEIFVGAMTSYGFNKILLGIATDHKDINLKAGIGVIRNFPDDWMKYYHENSFEKIDPIVTYGVHQAGAFVWDDISNHVELKPIQKKCLNLSEDSGLHNGLTVPLRGPHFQIAGLSLASSEKKDACYFNADLITAFCNHFYIAYKRLHQKNPMNPKNIILTDMEKEVLTWAAIGKTDDEIGEILTISRHTVNFHFRNIYQKIDANSKVLAVVKALTTGLVRI